MVGNILLTLFFVFLNAFFVAAEFALVKVRASQVEIKLRSGNKIAIITKYLIEHLDSYLSACQFGITLASLGLGWIGESVVTSIILEVVKLTGIIVSPELAHKISLPVAFGLITVLHIVFGELAPKSLALSKPQSVAQFISIPLRVFHFIFKPIIIFLNSFANYTIKVFGIKIISGHEVHTAEELELLLDEGSKSGVLDTSEHKLIKNVFNFSETPIKQIMVPRNKIVAVEENAGTEKIFLKFNEEGYSRMPVYNKSIDNIIGVIYAKDLISLALNRELIIIHDVIRPLLFVNENDLIRDLLKQLQIKKMLMAVVLDEFGGTAGLVTMEDILEELVGEIQDEYDEETPIMEKLDELNFRIKASAPISDVNEMLPVPLPESEDYQTVGGFIMNWTGDIPNINEQIEIDNFKFKILDKDKNNLNMLHLEIKKEVEINGIEE